MYNKIIYSSVYFLFKNVWYCICKRIPICIYNYCIAEIYCFRVSFFCISSIQFDHFEIYCKFNILTCFLLEMLIFFKVFRMINGLHRVAFHTCIKHFFQFWNRFIYFANASFFSRVPKTIIVISLGLPETNVYDTCIIVCVCNTSWVCCSVFPLVKLIIQFGTRSPRRWLRSSRSDDFSAETIFIRRLRRSFMASSRIATSFFLRSFLAG